MCGSPSLSASNEERDLALFIRVLKEMFENERWGDVEPCARRAWNQIALINTVQWEQVRDCVRRNWQLH